MVEVPLKKRMINVLMRNQAMFSFIWASKVILLPGFFALLPLVVLIERIALRKEVLVPSERQLIGYVFRSLTLGGLILVLFLLLTGMITFSPKQDTGLYFGSDAIVWRVTSQISLGFFYHPGTSLIALSLLIGFFYTGIIFLPIYCADSPRISKVEAGASFSSLEKKDVSIVEESTAIASQFVGGAAGVSSGTLCCTTSLFTIVAPALTSALTPFSYYFLIASFILVEYAILRVIVRRLTISLP